jgi:hypothetical protein
VKDDEPVDLVRVGTAVIGAWRLLRGDRGGLGLLDRGAAGALASFQAAIFVLPIWALIRWDMVGGAIDVAGPVQPLVVETLGYVIRWAMVPVMLLVLADLTGRRAQAPLAITAYNWGQLIIAALIAPVLILLALGVPSDWLNPFYVVWLIGSFVYVWWILKAALGVDGWIAAAFVIVDFIASQILAVIIDGTIVS